jgi:hypothetical protein
MASHYILLRNSDDHVLEEADSTRFRKTGTPPVLKSEKGLRWLDLVVVDPPVGVDQIKEGPTVDITDTTYTRTWTVRDKTADELDADKTQEAHFKFIAIKPLLLALNDGSFVPGSNYTVAQIKSKLKAKL